MGNKISWEDAQNNGLQNKNVSIFAKDNKYGYRLNVNHPWVKKQYERYKAKVNELILSDKQRFDFEEQVLQWLQKSAALKNKGEENTNA